MALPLLPLLFGAAALLILGKRKPKRGQSGSEPEEAPGSVTPPGMPPAPKPGGIQDPTGGWIKSVPGKAKIQPPVWNNQMAARARTYMESRWESGDKILYGAGTWFRLQRDTAMSLWPQWNWPKTTTDESRTIYVPPGTYVPAFIYDAGENGPKIEQIWTHLRDIAWDVTNYVPVT